MAPGKGRTLQNFIKGHLLKDVNPLDPIIHFFPLQLLHQNIYILTFYNNSLTI